jgi:hypothetical protein
MHLYTIQLHREARYSVDSLGVDFLAAAQLAQTAASNRRRDHTGFSPLFYFADDDDESTSAYLATMCVQPHPDSVRHLGGVGDVTVPFAACHKGTATLASPQQCGVGMSCLHCKCVCLFMFVVV